LLKNQYPGDGFLLKMTVINETKDANFERIDNSAGWNRSKTVRRSKNQCK
jgi:hypothetical protein